MTIDTKLILPPEGTHRRSEDPELPAADENTPLLPPPSDPTLHPQDTPAASPISRAVAFQDPPEGDEASVQQPYDDMDGNNDDDHQSGYATSGYMGHSTAPPSYHTIAHTDRNALSDSDDESEDANPFFHGPYTDAWRERRRLRARKHKIRKCIRFSVSALLLLVIGYALGKLMLEGDSGPGVPYLPAPSPPAEDGRPMKPPIWSTPHKLPFDKRPIHNGDSNMDVWFTSTEFTLQSTNSLWFHEKGDHIVGELLVLTGIDAADLPASSDNDDVAVVVNVEAIYSDQHLFDSITVARMIDEQAGSEGIGIYEARAQAQESHPYAEQEMINFSVTYYMIGARPGQPPASISNMSVVTDNMSLMTNTMDTDEHMTFGSWSTSTKNGPITIKSIAATESITLETENAPITLKAARAPVLLSRSNTGRLSLGTIVIAESTTLSCENSAIDVVDLRAPSITVTSVHGRLDGTFNVSRSLHLETKTGGIGASIHSSGNTTVTSRTQAGSIGIAYYTLMPGTSLNGTATSEAGIVDVAHGPTFQGAFVGEAKTGPLDVRAPPEQEGRVWEIDTGEGHIGRRVRGRTWWERGSTVAPRDKHPSHPPAVGWSTSVATSAAGGVGLMFM